MDYTLSREQLLALLARHVTYPGKTMDELMVMGGIENPESETYSGMAHDFEQMRAALRKCLPSKSHMNCSAEDFRGDEHISVTMHRREWEQIAEMALSADELREYIKYPRERKGDPNCETCHGAGCADCNDDIYYTQQEVAEQVGRDAELDFARRIAD